MPCTTSSWLQRQDEVLRVSVEQAEGQVVVVEAAMDGIVRHVVERVVHPAHVPLEAEAEPARIRRMRNAAPGCRFFRDRHAAGEQAVGLLVRALQEADRIAVFIAAVGVGQPLAGLARIIEIEHGGHRIHAQAVDMEAVEPIERVGAEEIGDFPAAEIVNGRVPVRVEAAARIGMLVKRGAVEIGEAVLVGGKMRRHPIEDHAEPGLMRAVDEALEPGRVAVTRRVGANRPMGW